MNDNPYIHLRSIGADFLAVADALVEARDLDALDALRGALVDLVLGGVAAGDISLTGIKEYVAEASDILRAGRTTADAKASTIRQLLGDR